MFGYLIDSQAFASTEFLHHYRIKQKTPHITVRRLGAENETRTRDPDLGKVVLYQLSYFRSISMNRSLNGTAKIRQKSELANIF